MYINMKSLSQSGKKFQHLTIVSYKTTRLFTSCCYHELVFRINSFFIHILYFLSLSFLGYGVLKSLKPRTPFSPRNIDLYFTSVSAVTVSSMSTVEMEVFSNDQLILITILMVIGGEVFTSMIGLYLNRLKTSTKWNSIKERIESLESDHIELSVNVTVSNTSNTSFLKYDSIMFLGHVILGYFLVIQTLGIMSVFLYVTLVSSAQTVLRSKGIKPATFAVFTIVSTFASCGFVPTNENMVIFSRNSGLLLILMPQIFLGNTLLPPALRVVIWGLGKKVKRVEADYLLSNTREVGFLHLLGSVHCVMLVATVFGLSVVGIVMFCAMEWNLDGLEGMNSFQKVVGILFQCVNARHAGESVVDLSTVAPAILVFFIILMYLPPYTSFLPSNGDEQNPPKLEERNKSRKRVAKDLIFSQLGYLVIFIILICITERKSMKEDPLNFSVLNIVLEVISAYGNVGFTTGYSCQRQVRMDPKCVNKLYGFSGKWSDEGKIVLILVMFFGRLKKFNMNGGRAWKLL